jgi:hypothetical protein
MAMVAFLSTTITVIVAKLASTRNFSQNLYRQVRNYRCSIAVALVVSVAKLAIASKAIAIIKLISAIGSSDVIKFAMVTSMTFIVEVILKSMA